MAKKKITLPKVWEEECKDVAQAAADQIHDIIIECMQDARFGYFLAVGPENDREEVLQDMIFERVYQEFTKLVAPQRATRRK